MEQKPHEITIDVYQTLDSMLHMVLNSALVAANADAGSLMLVDNKHGILQIKARLGKPRPGRTREPVYSIGGHSIASWVVRNKRCYICEDVDKDEHFAPSSAGKNFSSLLSVPVIYKDKVLAVINADSTEVGYFTQDHREKMEEVAMVVATPIAERTSVLDALAEIGVDFSGLSRMGGVDSVLMSIAKLAVRSLGADLVTLYQYDQGIDDFPVEGTGPTIYPENALRLPGIMRNKIYPGDVPRTMVRERKSGFYADVYKEEFLSGSVKRTGEPDRDRFIVREGIRSMAALLLPFRAAENKDEEVVGVMFANYRTLHDFNTDERKALTTFADYAATAILNTRREEQRREEQRRIEQLKMAEIVLATFAHRMGSLAGPGRVAALILRNRIDPQDEISHRQIDLIERKSDVLLELAERLVRPFRESDSMYPLDITGIIDQALDRVSVDLNENGIKVEKNIRSGLPQVQSVEFQLCEVLCDMFNNAIESMSEQEHGKLIVSAQFNNISNRVEIEISDTGPGIDKTIQEKLFTLGATTKDSLGIGLWWSKTFLQTTGGDVKLKNTARGTGTTFLIEIPCASQKPSTKVSNRVQMREVDILIVDDNLDWQNQMIDTLNSVQPEAYSIETATTYSDAIEALKNNHFKLAIIDMRLVDADQENKDGLRLLSYTDKAQLDTKVIIITAYGRDEDRAYAEDSRSLLSFIDKAKIDLDDFSDTVRRAIGDE